MKIDRNKLHPFSKIMLFFGILTVLMFFICYYVLCIETGESIILSII